SASSRRSCASGPTPSPTPPQPIASGRSAPGCASTTTSARTPPSAIAVPSPASRRPRHEQRPWLQHLGLLDADSLTAVETARKPAIWGRQGLLEHLEVEVLRRDVRGARANPAAERGTRRQPLEVFREGVHVADGDQEAALAVSNHFRNRSDRRRHGGKTRG